MTSGKLQRKMKDKEMFKILEKGAQVKYQTEESIFLFSGFYYPEIWKYDKDKESLILLTQNELKSDYYRGRFDIFNTYTEGDGKLVFYSSDEPSSIFVFNTKTEEYFVIAEDNALFLGFSKFRNGDFYILNVFSDIERIQLQDSEGIVKFTAVGFHKNGTFELYISDDDSNYLNERMKEASTNIENILNNLSEYSLVKRIKKSGHYYGTCKSDDAEYFFLGTLPLTIIEVTDYGYRYYVGNNYQIPIIPRKISYLEDSEQLKISSFIDINSTGVRTIIIDCADFI